MGIPALAGVSASGLPPAGDKANAVVSGTITAVGPTQPFAFRGRVNIALYASYNTSLTTTNGSLTASVGTSGAIAAGTSIKSANVPAGTTFGAFTGPGGTLALPAITLWGFTDAGASQINGVERTSGLIGATISGPGIQAGTTITSIVQEMVPATIHNPQVRGVFGLSLPVTAVPAIVARQPFLVGLGSNAVVSGTDAAAIFTGSAITYTATINLERSFDGGSTWIHIGAAPLDISEAEACVLYRLNCTAYTSGTINYRISQTGVAATALDLSGAL